MAAAVFPTGTYKNNSNTVSSSPSWQALCGNVEVWKTQGEPEGDLDDTLTLTLTPTLTLTLTSMTPSSGKLRLMMRILPRVFFL